MFNEMTKDRDPEGDLRDDTMHCNAVGIAIIKKYEKFRSNPYKDYGGTWTIGFGHTQGVHANTQPVSEEYALKLLREDVFEAEEAVERLVTYELTSNQFSALVSFVYNIGQGNFERSSALYCLNAGDFEGVGKHMALWNKDAGKVMGGLVDRRADEAALFYEPEPESDDEEISLT